MINPDNLEEIKRTIMEFFKRATFEVDIEFLSQENSTLPINIKAENPQILIGEGGQTLADMQHLLKAMLRKKIQDNFYLNLDINDYKKKKIEYLKELAKLTADEVTLMKEEKVLPSMSAYERRIVHMQLAEREDIVTESTGRDPERKIIIKPASL